MPAPIAPPSCAIRRSPWRAGYRFRRRMPKRDIHHGQAVFPSQTVTLFLACWEPGGSGEIPTGPPPGVARPWGLSKFTVPSPIGAEPVPAD